MYHTSEMMNYRDKSVLQIILNRKTTLFKRVMAQTGSIKLTLHLYQAKDGQHDV